MPEFSEPELPWTVYTLTDPRDGTVFYIGCSRNPRRRIRDHNGDPALAAYRRCCKIRAAGLRCVLTVIARHSTKREAMMQERRLIVEGDGKLVNRERGWPRSMCREPIKAGAVAQAL